ncbi:hypothetical protein PAXRUDRAFT_165600 [Paxillus rubicundulus Ve08.2h10]|uniref:Uncharacterized protein n=1 Tax=Paxillus rubicundulus Ve08.2h10 TaxID=930991 RepID=A0A0D0DID7_9AGAM|nr:hypothetical protein PAXRUDRAFT_165600 [Paxillus rubicundulus Ve08.2h10]
MSYTPDESSAQFFAEESWLAGAIITGAGYGIVLALFWLSFRNLWGRIKIRDVSRRRNICFLVYICVMAVLGSLFLASNSQFTQLAFINHRNFPGGPSAYEQQMFSVGVDEIGNVSFTLANWLADSLLVWRCLIISRDTVTFSYWIVPVVVPCLMQLTSYVLGVFFLIQISSPSSSPYFTSKGINWTLPYLFISFAINIVVSILITYRLLLHRRRTIQDLGPGHATESASLAAMIVESASLYSTFSLLFLIPFALKSPVSNAFLQVLGEAQLIAPLLIIYRESQGKGWISSTSSATASTVTSNQAIRLGQFSDIRFASRGRSPYSTGVGAVHTLDEKEDAQAVEEVRRADVHEVESA